MRVLCAHFLTPVVIMLALGCMGAHCQPVPTTLDAGSQADWPACPTTTPTSADVCSGYFTRDGAHACARCPGGASGCWDALDSIYCVAGGCADPTCAYRP